MGKRAAGKKEVDKKAKKRIQERQELLASMQGWWTTFFCILMLAVFPLFYRNNYIDITQSKQRFFLAVGGVYVVVTLILQGRKGKELFLPHTVADKFGLFLFAVAVISTVVSGDWTEAFFANSGRYFGADVLLLSILCYFFVSRTFSMEKARYVSWMTGISVVLLFSLEVMNTFQLDPLQMRQNLVEEQWSIFISTLGQLNVNAAMNGFMMAVAGSTFLTAEKRWLRMCLVPILLLGSMAMICCRSDSAVVLLFVLSALFFWYAMGKRERIWKGAVYFAAQMVGLHIMALLVGKWESHMFPLNSLNQRIVQWHVLIKMDVVMVLVFIAAWMLYKKSLSEKAYHLLQKIVLLVGGIAGVGGIVWLLSHFHITDDFAGGRGYIWKKTVEEFMQQPLIHKLFGVGMQGFPQLVEDWREETIALFGSPFIDAHNEYLQYMATIGILGAIGYFGFLLSMLWDNYRGVTRRKRSIFQISLIAVYLTQALVNNPLSFTVPYCFVLWGIFSYSGHQSDSELQFDCEM